MHLRLKDMDTCHSGDRREPWALRRTAQVMWCGQCQPTSHDTLQHFTNTWHLQRWRRGTADQGADIWKPFGNLPHQDTRPIAVIQACPDPPLLSLTFDAKTHVIFCQ